MTNAQAEQVIEQLACLVAVLGRIADGLDQVGETLAVELGDISLIALKSTGDPVELSRRPTES